MDSLVYGRNLLKRFGDLGHPLKITPLGIEGESFDGAKEAVDRVVDHSVVLHLLPLLGVPPWRFRPMYRQEKPAEWLHFPLSAKVNNCSFTPSKPSLH